MAGSLHTSETRRGKDWWLVFPEKWWKKQIDNQNDFLKKKLWFSEIWGELWLLDVTFGLTALWRVAPNDLKTDKQKIRCHQMLPKQQVIWHFEENVTRQGPLLRSTPRRRCHDTSMSHRWPRRTTCEKTYKSSQWFVLITWRQDVQIYDFFFFLCCLMSLIFFYCGTLQSKIRDLVFGWSFHTTP